MMQTGTLKEECVSDPKDSFLLSAHRGMDIQPAPCPISPGSDPLHAQAESTAPCSAVGATLGPCPPHPPVVLEPAVATAEDAANSMSVPEAGSGGQPVSAVAEPAAQPGHSAASTADSASERQVSMTSMPAEAPSSSNGSKPSTSSGGTDTTAVASADAQTGNDQPEDKASKELMPVANCTVSNSSVMPLDVSTSAAAHKGDLSGWNAADVLATTAEDDVAGALHADAELGGETAFDLQHSAETSQRSIVAASPDRDAIVGCTTSRTDTSDIGHSGSPVSGREVDTSGVRHSAAAEQASAAIIGDAQRQPPTQTSSFVRQSATAADAEEDPHGSAGSATHEAEVRSGADALQGDRHVEEQQASSPAAFEEPVHPPTPAAAPPQSDQTLPHSGVADEPQSFVSAQQLTEQHLSSSSAATKDRSPAEAAAPAQPHQSLPQSAVHGDAEQALDADSQRDEQQAASDQDVAQHPSGEEEQQQPPSSSTAGDVPDVTPDVEEEEHGVFAMEEERKQLEGVDDLISDKEDQQQDPFLTAVEETEQHDNPDLEEEEEHTSAQSSSQGTEEQLALHNNIEKEEEQMAQRAAAPLLPPALPASAPQLQTNTSSGAKPPAVDRPQKAVEEVKPKAKPGFLTKALCSIAWPVLLPICFAGGCINLYDACNMTEFLKYTA